MNSTINFRFRHMLRLIFSIIFFLNFESVLGSLKFELSAERPKCYLEELYSGYVMMIKWKVGGVEESDRKKLDQFLSHIQIYIKKENSNDVLKREYLKSEKGKFSFNSNSDDTYRICVSYHGGWTIPYPALVGIKISSENMDHPDLSNAIKLQDLDDVHKKTSQIIESAKQYIEVQKSEISREELHAKDHISFSRSFYYVTVFQVIVIVGLGLYQVFNFRKFLASNNVF
jgi:hypothetical protein